MFPENYPKCLEAVSWDFNDKFGIYSKWNYHCNHMQKNHPDFILNMLLIYVKNHEYPSYQILPKNVYMLVVYIADSFSVKWADDEFCVTLSKHKKDNKYKPKFNEFEYFELAEKAGKDKAEAKKFLKNCLNAMKKHYNKILLNSFQNVNKNLN